jgi:polar amino acid transport system ATP-binding protein
MIYNSNSSVIRTNSLKKNFGNESVLNGIDFEARNGEIISIIGRSGCGKTTFLRCLNCLTILNHGSIKISGIELSSEEFKGQKIGDDIKTNNDNDNFLKDSLQYITSDSIQNKVHKIRKSVGFLFQNLNLFPHLSVIENVKLPLEKVLLKSKGESHYEAELLLKKVGMERFAERNSAKISGGQAQRVAIARALAVNPEIMLYDEPTSALDPELVLEFIEIVRQLKSEGMTQIIVTHALGLAKNVSEYVAFMDKGLIIEKSTPAELFDNPKDERTKDYIGKLLLN